MKRVFSLATVLWLGSTLFAQNGPNPFLAPGQVDSLSGATSSKGFLNNGYQAPSQKRQVPAQNYSDGRTSRVLGQVLISRGKYYLRTNGYEFSLDLSRNSNLALSLKNGDTVMVEGSLLTSGTFQVSRLVQASRQALAASSRERDYESDDGGWGDRD